MYVENFKFRIMERLDFARNELLNVLWAESLSTHSGMRLLKLIKPQDV